MLITNAENDEKILIIDKLQQELSQLKEISEKTQQQIAETNEQFDDRYKKKENELNTLHSNLEQKDKELNEKLILITELDQSKNTLLKENDKLKMELSSKSFDLENTMDKILELEKQLKAGTEDLNIAKVSLGEKDANQEHQKKIVEELNRELKELQETLQTKLSEIEDLKKISERESKLKDKQIEEANEAVSRHKREIENLDRALTETKCSAEKKEMELSDIHSTQIKSQDLELKALSTDVQQKYEETVKLKLVVSKLEEDICTKNTLIKKISLEKEEIEHQSDGYKTEMQQMQQQINDLTLNYGDLQRQLAASSERITSLQEVKQRLDLEIAALTTKCENPEQVQQLRAELMAKEQTLDSLRSEFEQKIQILERTHHELELQHEQAVRKWNKQEQEFMTQAKISADSEIELKAQIDNYTQELSKMREQSQTVIANLEHSINEKTLLLENLEVKYTLNEKLQETQLMAVKEELNRNAQYYEEKITTVTNENTLIKNELNMKSAQVEELNTKCSQLLEDATKYQTHQKQNFDEVINKLQLEVNEKSMQVETLNLQLQKNREDSHQLLNNLQEKLTYNEQLHQTELTNFKQELSGSVDNYQERIKTLNEDNIHFKEQLEVKSNQIVELNSKCIQLETDAQQSQSEQKQNFDEVINKLQLQVNEKTIQVDTLNLQLQKDREDSHQLINNLEEKLAYNEQLHKNELTKLKEEQSDSLANYQERISTLNEENIHFKEQLDAKSDQIVELNSKCVQLEIGAQQSQSEQNQSFDQIIGTLQVEIKEKNVQLDKLLVDLQQAQESCKDLHAKDQQISELIAQNQSTQTLIAQLQGDLNQFKLLSDQKCKEQNTTQTQYEELLDQVVILEGKLQESETCKKNLQIEHNNAVELMTYLSVTQNQKEKCMKQLANDTRHCKYVQELLNQMRVNVDQNEEKVLMLQKEVEYSKNELKECNKAFEQQKNEMIRFQDLHSQVGLFCYYLCILK